MTYRMIGAKPLSDSMPTQVSFCVYAQPMRDELQRRLSLAGRIIAYTNDPRCLVIINQTPGTSLY